MEWREAGGLQFYMYVNEHQKWPLQNMYYTSLLVNTRPRSMISHIKIMSPRNVSLLQLKQMSILRLVSNAVTKLWSKHLVHLNMKASKSSSSNPWLLQELHEYQMYCKMLLQQISTLVDNQNSTSPRNVPVSGLWIDFFISQPTMIWGPDQVHL